MLESLPRDVLLAWRGLRQARGFTAAAVITLAIGMAGTVVMFSIVHGVLLRPLAVRDQDRLIVAWRQPPTRSGHWPFQPQEVDALATDSRLLADVAGVDYNGANPIVAVDHGNASFVNVVGITGRFAEVLGLRPLLGRTLDQSDDVKGAEPMIAISYPLWQPVRRRA